MLHGGYVETVNVNWKFVYYESRKWEVKKRRKNEYQCGDERLKTNDEECTCLGYTGLYEELEHLKIKTRLICAKFANVMGEYSIQTNILDCVFIMDQ